MCNARYSAASLAALAVLGVSSAFADPEPDPTYTHCELEPNDACLGESGEDLSECVDVTAREPRQADCFFITGKLQKDYVWGREPKCALVFYDKPEVCYDEDGDPQSTALEPIIASTTSGHITNVPVIPDGFGAAPGAGTGTVRIGIAVTSDVFADGTVNGLAFNNPHEEHGLVKVKVFPAGTTTTLVDDGDTHEGSIGCYEFYFEGGDAARVAFATESGVSAVDVWCLEDCGVEEVCYDIDFYTIKGLRAKELYCLTVIGGVDYYCDKTDTQLLGFQKGWVPIFGEGMKDDDGGQGVYSQLCLFADQDGKIRVGVTGSGDDNGNGLCDTDEDDFLDFLEEFDLGEFVPGASVYDNKGDLIRIPNDDNFGEDDHRLFDKNPDFQVPPGHDICGGYCIQVKLTNHIDSGDESPSGGSMSAASADFNADSRVNSADLAMLLSFWGPVL